MFKHFAATFFHRRPQADMVCGDAGAMTRSELQDLFRSDLEVHNRSALEINSRHANRRPDAFAA